MNLRDRVLTLPPKLDETVEVNCRSDPHITIFRFSDLKTIKNHGNDERDGLSAKQRSRQILHTISVEKV